MTKQARRVGLFVVIGFLIFFGIIFKIAFENVFMSKHDLFVMNFQESVKGLTVGSPVVLDGVEVGKVTQIQLIATKDTLGFQIPVYVRFNPNKVLRGHPTFTNMIERETIYHELIKKGLRARLTTQNYLTGQLMIELVMLEDEEPVFRMDHHHTGIYEIPTVLSTMGELSQGLQDLPLTEIIQKSDKILASLQENLPVILPKITILLDTLTQTATQMQSLTPQARTTLQKSAQTLNNTNETLDDISSAMISLKNLTDYLEQHPESVIKGKPNK